MTTVTPGRSVASASAPDRSLEQRMIALATANDTRSRRAELKRDIAAGEVNVWDLIAELPEDYLKTMKVIDVLLAMPKVGRVKANKLLARTRVSPTKTLAGLTYRQRDEILEFAGRPNPAGMRTAATR